MNPGLLALYYILGRYITNDAVQPLLVIHCNIQIDKSFGTGQLQRYSQPNTFTLDRFNLNPEVELVDACSYSETTE